MIHYQLLDERNGLGDRPKVRTTSVDGMGGVVDPISFTGHQYSSLERILKIGLQTKDVKAK